MLPVKRKMTVRFKFLAQKGPIGYLKDMITPAQIKAARAMLNWRQTDLAKAAGVSEMSIKNVENGKTDSRVSTIQAIQTALESAGVIFLESGDVAAGPGVSIKRD